MILAIIGSVGAAYDMANLRADSQTTACAGPEDGRYVSTTRVALGSTLLGGASYLTPRHTMGVYLASALEAVYLPRIQQDLKTKC